MKPPSRFIRILRCGLRAVSSICLLAGLPLYAQKVQHPLDPLNFQEYWTVLEVLDESGHVDEDTRFSLINLIPPSKDLVWNWKKGDEYPRVKGGGKLDRWGGAKLDRSWAEGQFLSAFSWGGWNGAWGRP